MSWAVSGLLSLWGLPYVQLLLEPQVWGQEQHSTHCAPLPATAAHLGRPVASRFLGDEVWRLVPPKHVSLKTTPEACMWRNVRQRGPESCPKLHSKLVTGPGRPAPGQDAELPTPAQLPFVAKLPAQ